MEHKLALIVFLQFLYQISGLGFLFRKNQHIFLLSFTIVSCWVELDLCLITLLHLLERSAHIVYRWTKLSLFPHCFSSLPYLQERNLHKGFLKDAVSSIIFHCG